MMLSERGGATFNGQAGDGNGTAYRRGEGICVGVNAPARPTRGRERERSCRGSVCLDRVRGI